MRFELPAPHAVFALDMDDSSQIKVRRHGNKDGVRLFICHGNGFAVDAYYPFWGPLLRDFEIVLFDARNHGQNMPSDPAHHHYAQMARDIDRVIDGVDAALGRRTSVGIFHSMSARAAMKHAVEIGWRWDAMVLFDPPNVPPPGHRLHEPMVKFENRLASWARGRRMRFADPSELTQEYLSSRATANWVDGTHELMARSVMRRSDGSDGWVLACTPELEASIYAQAMALNLWPHNSAFGGPVKLVGADPAIAGGPPTGLANQALAAENGYDYAAVAGSGHLLQIEKPAACVDALISFLTARGLRA
jgi:pimeloyl-ACP methyl ester carboxylesterase